MTEQERLLNKENNILQNQNISYADGEEQAKKHLEQFKQNLIENFNEAELREEFVDECKDTDKQESIKLKNVDSLFAHKRFIYKNYGYDGWMVNDTQNEFNDEIYEDIPEEKVVELLNRYYEKKEYYKGTLMNYNRILNEITDKLMIITGKQSSFEEVQEKLNEANENLVKVCFENDDLKRRLKKYE